MIPTVFIHGAGGSAKHWFPLTAKLDSEFLFFYELPGHGDRIDNLAPDMTSAVKDFTGFIEKNKLNQFNLIAHSLGGLIAIQYALTFSEKISKLILISTAAKILMHPDFVKQIYSRDLNFEFLCEGFAENITEDAKQLVMNDLSRLTFEKPSDDFMSVADCNLTGQLDQLMMPALILIGELDRIISPRRSRELSKRIPSSQLFIIPDAAHYPHLENIEITANIINQFIRNNYEVKLFA